MIELLEAYQPRLGQLILLIIWDGRILLVCTFGLVSGLLHSFEILGTILAKVQNVSFTFSSLTFVVILQLFSTFEVEQ